MSSLWNESGYASAAYLRALGLTPRALGRTGGYLVERALPGGGVDLAGAYPLFACQDWQALARAVADLPAGPITLTLVSDPFNPLGAAGLGAIFPVCRKLHDHWIVDLSAPPVVSRHHRRKLRAAGAVRIEAGPADPALGAAWAALYGHLVAKKSIRDARAFSPQSLAAQLAVPGAQLVTAWDGPQLLGADLYYLDRGRAYAHLSAYAPEGYARSVSYPMLAAAIEHFRTSASVIDLGGAPAGPAGQGIAHFKSGWTSQTLPSHLCGKVLDARAYLELAPGADPDGFFPAYRAGEYRH